MSEFTSRILKLETEMEHYKQAEEKVNSLIKKLETDNDLYCVYLETQQILSSVSDSNAKAILQYITGIINKALAVVFPYGDIRIDIDTPVGVRNKANIKIKLLDGDKTRDLAEGVGSGIGQVVSFLFILSIIDLRKGRKLVILDELLNALHEKAKNVVMEIIKIFTEEGFQFVLIEHNSANNLGKIYLVEKPDDKATIHALDTGEYKNEVFIFNKPVDYDETVQVIEDDVDVPPALI